MGCRDDVRNNDAALPRPLRALRRMPKLWPRPAPCADRSGNGRPRGAPHLQLPGMQPLGNRSGR